MGNKINQPVNTPVKGYQTTSQSMKKLNTFEEKTFSYTAEKEKRNQYIDSDTILDDQKSSSEISQILE